MVAGTGDGARPRRRYRPAVGPRLRPLLFAVFGLFALLVVNSVYLLAVRLLGLATGEVYENWFYLVVFLGHLALGLLVVVPVIAFGVGHFANTRDRRNRRAVRVGYALFTTALLVLATGVALMRVEGVLDVRDPDVRAVLWWVHVLAPAAAVWLFVLHRLAGKKIRWRVGLGWAGVAVASAIALAAWHAQDPRRWNVEGNPDGDAYFFPSLARTVSGDFIPARLLMNDRYCLECHHDIHAGWSRSVHRFSSFNNPAYLFSVRKTREFSMKRDGNVNASRFCAGCHDPVPFFSGRFSDPDYDDVRDPTARAGVTCTVCHSITHLNSPRGNSDYTIDAPVHYPFAFSKVPALRWINRQLVKAKPEFHRKTFLKPLHRTAEFCGTCHKVHLPVEFNGYKWLRGQDHYDSYLLSGVSGHGVASFYYPPKAEPNCQGCHMPLVPSHDFGARRPEGGGELSIHDHLFPSANTAVPVLAGFEDAAAVVARHRGFLRGVMRLDLFGVRDGGTIDGRLVAPLRPEVPALRPGGHYLLEAVIRTLKMGHAFTQGTADSNEIWVEMTVLDGGRVIGRSGWMDDRGEVDPFAHRVNAYVLDRDGRRIDRRNPEDIFVPLYNHQIPPGAGDVVHYLLEVPRSAAGPITVEARLHYRKFDAVYMRHVFGPDHVDDLPITTLAVDRVVFPVAGGREASEQAAPDFPEWQRWNDYGIGLLRRPGRGELRQAEEAFAKVESLGRPDGPLNLARVYLREGRIAKDAPAALARAAGFDPHPNAWTVLWLSGLVNRQNGRLDDAVRDLSQIVEGGFEQAAGRGFDFSRDYRLLDELGAALYERALRERGDARREARERDLDAATGWFERALRLDPENVTAHWFLKQIATLRGDTVLAARHGGLHEKYKADDNARDRAIALARARDAAADFAARPVVLYPLGGDPAYTRRPAGSMEVPGR